MLSKLLEYSVLSKVVGIQCVQQVSRNTVCAQQVSRNTKSELRKLGFCLAKLLIYNIKQHNPVTKKSSKKSYSSLCSYHIICKLKLILLIFVLGTYETFFKNFSYSE